MPGCIRVGRVWPAQEQTPSRTPVARPMVFDGGALDRSPFFGAGRAAVCWRGASVLLEHQVGQTCAVYAQRGELGW